MSASLPNVKIALLNTAEPIDIQVSDANGDPYDAQSVKLNIMDMGGTIMWSDDISSPTTHIVKPTDTVGYYYYNFGDPANNANGNVQTSYVGDYLAQWYIIGQPGTLPQVVTQNVKVVGPLAFANIPYIRMIIDKARKVVDPSNDVYLGYTDSQLIMFMENGMQIINGYQPETVSGFTIDNFPWRDFRHIANEAALMAGVLSQQLFAIDTDLPNYTDQGTTFVIAHQPQLASVLNQVSQRLDKAIPAMKLQFVSTGSIHLEQGPNFRLAQLLQAAPSGALFRNIFFKG